MLHHRLDHRVDELGFRERRQTVLAGDRHRRADDVAGRDAPALPGEGVAAAGTAHALEDALPDQGLEDRFGDAGAGDCGGRPGLWPPPAWAARAGRDVHDGGDGEEGCGAT